MKKRLLDIHTHHDAPQPEGVVAICVKPEITGYKFTEGQAYSVGIHPWDTVAEPTDRMWDELRRIAERKDVKAIGEAGIDLTPHGGPLFRQLLVFRKQVELSEELCKPLVIHDVKAHDIITGARRDLKPCQNWAIHGFRRKPEVAQMLLRAGCYISFGAQYNEDSLLSMPLDRILAETDESEHDIEEVIEKLSQTVGRDLTDIIAENTARFLGIDAKAGVIHQPEMIRERTSQMAHYASDSAEPNPAHAYDP
ncbi:MAG: TatD family hydrolase [Candidatus Amulumruptor caecigallinarius]|nr:TatD family hydrolase [Candidatus Amulumruptor caecigallinarius]